jgi:hypothetical protein
LQKWTEEVTEKILKARTEAKRPNGWILITHQDDNHSKRFPHIFKNPSTITARRFLHQKYKLSLSITDKIEIEDTTHQ